VLPRRLRLRPGGNGKEEERHNARTESKKIGLFIPCFIDASFPKLGSRRCNCSSDSISTLSIHQIRHAVAKSRADYRAAPDVGERTATAARRADVVDARMGGDACPRV
jgi:hypothetical protein